MNNPGVPEIENAIRLAVPADAPAIARVLAEAFAAFQPLYTPQAYAATTPGAE
jgi:hypothetical protein